VAVGAAVATGGRVAAGGRVAVGGTAVAAVGAAVAAGAADVDVAGEVGVAASPEQATARTAIPKIRPNAISLTSFITYFLLESKLLSILLHHSPRLGRCTRNGLLAEGLYPGMERDQ